MKIEAILLWILASLLAISFVGDEPIFGLVIAIMGGIMVGILLVADDIRRQAKKR